MISRGAKRDASLLKKFQEEIWINVEWNIQESCFEGMSSESGFSEIIVPVGQNGNIYRGALGFPMNHPYRVAVTVKILMFHLQQCLEVSCLFLLGFIRVQCTVLRIRRQNRVRREIMC